jgi:threonine dehydrogenase-like Zn-dependent dehydrogenase
VRAITVRPGERGSASLTDVEEPDAGGGSVRVQAVALGICGTDAEIVAGKYGWAPPGEDHLILGHESLGRVLEAPPEAGLTAGDLVVGIVRRPDPEPCLPCSRGEWDMCRNGRYTERGIKEIHGYGSERWRIEPEFAVRVDPSLGILGVLLEPTSVVAKAWEQIDRISARATTVIDSVLVTGAGPIGLLAALLARQRDLEVHVLDRMEDGPKPEAVRALGATYHSGSILDLPETDVIVECTGAGQVVLDAIQHNRPDGIVCLTGVSSGGHRLQVDAGELNRRLVLENDVVFGSVNANRRHYEQAARALAAAPEGWLSRLVSRRVPLDRWAEALDRKPDDIKVVLEFPTR